MPGRFAALGWSPVHDRELPELKAASRAFDEAQASGDLSAALGASSQMLLIQALQLSGDAKACRSEVFITEDGLGGSPADVLATLLHEAAHAIAAARAIKDTSRQGRYHNARFKAVAEEVGLELRRDPLIGWSMTTLATATATDYSQTLAELARGVDADREHSAATSADGILG